MSITSIQGLTPTQIRAIEDPNSPAADGSAFSEALERAIASTNSQLVQADVATQALAAGEPVSLHETVLAVEKADIATRAFITVKSRAIEAYQEVMRMQI
ncbi:MAG: flagellar hook-basal body complex protein FliE [Myxococcota bacterium]